MKRWRTIDINPGFFALLCAFFFFDPRGSFFPFLTGIALHEAAHLLTLRALGVSVLGFRLGLSGAVLRTAPMSFHQEWLSAAAGPLANFLLFALFLRNNTAFALVNLALMVYNLLPFYPLDGGRILRAVLHSLFSDHTAAAVEQVIRLIFLTVLGVGAVYLTCVWHAGLWPVAIYALLLLRIGQLSP